MALTKEEIIEAIASMSVKDVVELVSAMEEKFGVSAAAAVVAGPAAGAAARIFKEFAKKEDKFTIKGAAFEGEFISADSIDVLASLPTYEEAIARLMNVMKEAAAGKLVRCIDAVRAQKEESQPAA